MKRLPMPHVRLSPKRRRKDSPEMRKAHNAVSSQIGREARDAGVGDPHGGESTPRFVRHARERRHRLTVEEARELVRRELDEAEGERP